MDQQTAINLLFATCGAFGGVIMHRLWVSIDNLVHQDQLLADKVQSIEILVAGRYVQRSELADLSVRLFAALERIEVKLDRKMDKTNGNGVT
jgi:hypothetical protein